MRATNVGNKDHFKEEVTLGLLIKDGRKFEEEEGLSRTGEGRGGKGKTNTKSHECERVNKNLYEKSNVSGHWVCWDGWEMVRDNCWGVQGGWGCHITKGSQYLCLSRACQTH